MKHFRVGKNAQVVVYVVGNQLVTIINFEGNHKSTLFGRTYDGNYTHLNPENLLPDYQAFDEAEALLIASRAGEVEPLDEPEELSEETTEADEVKDVVEDFKGPESFSKIAVHADITEADIQAKLVTPPVLEPKAVSGPDSLEMSEPKIIKK